MRDKCRETQSDLFVWHPVLFLRQLTGHSQFSNPIGVELTADPSVLLLRVPAVVDNGLLEARGDNKFMGSLFQCDLPLEGIFKDLSPIIINYVSTPLLKTKDLEKGDFRTYS